MRNRWRVGRSLGRTLYVQVGDDASKDDIFMGIVESRAVADMVVKAVNEYLERESTEQIAWDLTPPEAKQKAPVCGFIFHVGGPLNLTDCMCLMPAGHDGWHRCDKEVVTHLDR